MNLVYLLSGELFVEAACLLQTLLMMSSKVLKLFELMKVAGPFLLLKRRRERLTLHW